MENLKIKWTFEAKSTYKENVLYLKLNWDKKTLENFINRTEKDLSILKDNPYAGVYDSILNCRKFLIVKQIYLLYTFDNEKKEIILITFWNNSRKPLKNLL